MNKTRELNKNSSGINWLKTQYETAWRLEIESRYLGLSRHKTFMSTQAIFISIFLASIGFLMDFSLLDLKPHLFRFNVIAICVIGIITGYLSLIVLDFLRSKNDTDHKYRKKIFAFVTSIEKQTGIDKRLAKTIGMRSSIKQPKNWFNFKRINIVIRWFKILWIAIIGAAITILSLIIFGVIRYQ